MKCRITGKKASSFTFRAHSPRSKQLAGEGLRAHRNRLPKNKHNPLCTDTCGRYRASGSSIHRDFPRGGAGTASKAAGKRVQRRKDRSPRRFSGSNARDMQSSRETRRRPSFHRPLCLRLLFSSRLLKNSSSLYLSTFRYCVGGRGRCTPGDDFCTAETAISAPAKLNCCSRGDERMAARGHGGRVARKVRRQETPGKRIAPRRRFRRRRNRGAEVALNFARSRRRSYANF